MVAMPRQANPIDAYLATVDGPRRAALRALRREIRSVLPKVEECLSYGIPAFRLEGRVVAGFAARRDGCSYFPFSGSTLATLGEALAGYERTKSSLHFSPERPLPASLVRRLLEARLAEPRTRAGRVKAPGSGSKGSRGTRGGRAAKAR
jgi:uncharacterized protein YdhG (YjbR/CyaY superfamily)